MTTPQIYVGGTYRIDASFKTSSDPYNHFYQDVNGLVLKIISVSKDTVLTEVLNNKKVNIPRAIRLGYNIGVGLNLNFNPKYMAPFRIINCKQGRTLLQTQDKKEPCLPQ